MLNLAIFIHLIRLGCTIVYEKFANTLHSLLLNVHSSPDPSKSRKSSNLRDFRWILAGNFISRIKQPILYNRHPDFEERMRIEWQNSLVHIQALQKDSRRN